ncbi:MAG: ATP-binding protein [Bacteroidia bacterium]
MKKEDDFNPFLITGYQTPDLFCDREKETSQLISNALNGTNTTLLSIRRMGKTGLLHHVNHQLQQKKKGIGIYVDIFDTESLRDFTNRLASAMLLALPKRHPFWKNAMAFLMNLRPVISYDEFTGQPQVMLDYAQPKQYEHTLQGILSFLEKQNKLVVVAIDEFQQITQYPEKNMEAILRTYVQKLRNVKFIFSGSSPHLLAEMFHHAKRPFFASTQSVELSEIDEKQYYAFIATLFAKYKRKITEQSLDYILSFTKRHTFYTQALCNRIFANGDTNIQLDQVQLAAHQLMMQNETIYFQYRTMLTSNQWAMLKVIAKEDKLYQPNAKSIVQKYRLGSTSGTQRSIEALLSKEMIYSKETETGKYYCVYDCFLARWLEQKQ